MESLQAEVEPFGVQTTIVNPGFFRTEILGERSARYAEPSIADYDERRSQQREWWEAQNGQQPGDPAKLAQAFVQIASENPPPHRFIAGADAGRSRRTEGRKPEETDRRLPRSVDVARSGSPARRTRHVTGLRGTAMSQDKIVSARHDGTTGDLKSRPIACTLTTLPATPLLVRVAIDPQGCTTVRAAPAVAGVYSRACTRQRRSQDSCTIRTRVCA